MTRSLLVLALASTLACRPSAPPASPDPLLSDSAPLWIPRRVSTFHLGVFERQEDASRSSLYRYVGPDSILFDVTLSPGPDLGTRCPLSCARDSLEATLRLTGARADGTPPERTVRTDELAARPDSPWMLGRRTVSRTTRDSVVTRTERHIYFLPGTRIWVSGTYEESPARDAVVAEFLRHVVDAFATPPLSLPEPTREGILASIVGEWDHVGSPMLCGPGRHTIRISDDTSSFVVTTPDAEGGPPRVTTYQIVRIGPGILAGKEHVIRGFVEGETRRGSAGDPLMWDLVLEDADRYTWHRNDWFDDQRSADVLRCDRGPY